MKIKAYSGGEPHPDYGGWENFLNNHCEVRQICRGVIHYGVTNCNYILFPDGTLIENYGYHGKSLMRKVAEKGPTKVLQEIREYHKAYAEAAKGYADSIKALIESLEQLRTRQLTPT